jgi:hypothetical protein
VGETVERPAHAKTTGAGNYDEFGLVYDFYIYTMKSELEIRQPWPKSTFLYSTSHSSTPAVQLMGGGMHVERTQFSWEKKMCYGPSIPEAFSTFYHTRYTAVGSLLAGSDNGSERSYFAIGPLGGVPRSRQSAHGLNCANLTWIGQLRYLSAVQAASSGADAA